MENNITDNKKKRKLCASSSPPHSLSKTSILPIIKDFGSTLNTTVSNNNNNSRRRRNRKRKILSSSSKKGNVSTESIISNIDNTVSSTTMTTNLITNLLENDIRSSSSPSVNKKRPLKQSIIEIVPIGKSGGIISRNSSYNNNICVKKKSSPSSTTNVKIKIEKVDDDENEVINNNNNNDGQCKLEILGKESIIDTNVSNNDSLPKEISNFLTFSDQRKEIQGFDGPDERYVTSGMRETISTINKRCKICYWALSGKLYNTYMPRDKEDVKRLLDKLSDSIHKKYNNGCGGGNDHMSISEMYNGISFLLSIKRWYKMLSDFSSNSEVYASVANIWNSQVEMTRTKLKKRIQKIYKRDMTSSTSNVVNRSTSSGNDDYGILNDIEDIVNQQDNDDSSVMEINTNGNCDSLEDTMGVDNKVDEAIMLQDVMNIFRKIESMVGIPPHLNVCEVEYHVMNCSSDIDIQLRDQFKLCSGLINHISKNTLFNTIVDADIDASTIDLTDTAQNFDGNGNNENDGLKRTQVIDYVELQKWIMLSTQSIRLSAELRVRKEKVNYPFSELSLLSSMKTAQLIKDNGNFGKIDLNHRLGSNLSSSSTKNKGGRIRNGRGKIVIRGGGENILADDMNRDYNSVGSLTKL